MVCGSINGYLIGYLRLRAFLTTLVTLIIFRSIYDILFLRMSTAIVAGYSDSDLLFFIGTGTVLGIPFSLWVTVIIAIAWHIVLSRMRPGWRLTAVGGARRSAYNAGISVRRTVFFAYVWSGALAALAGFLFAARLGSTGADTGVGLEVSALTAAVLGGNSLGGGRGSVAKAAMGALFVLILSNNLTNFGISGPVNSTILGCVLIAAVFVDMRWLRNRHKWLSKIYVSPAYLSLPAPPSAIDPKSPFALNDRLRSVEIIGLGAIDGPEDVILDRDDNLYCGTRHGDIVRFFGPDHQRHEVFAHIGGHPLGMAFDRSGNLLVCIGGMGLYPGHAQAGGDQADRRDQPQLPLGGRRFAPAPGRRSRHRAGRADLFQRSDRPLRAGGMGDRRAGEPRQRAHHLLRPAAPAPPGRRSTAWSSPTASAWPTTAARSSSPRAGSPRSAATISPGRRRGRPNASRRTCRAIPTTSIAPRTATTGRRCSACGRRRSTWRSRCRASGAAWRAGSRLTCGSIPTSIPAAW